MKNFFLLLMLIICSACASNPFSVYYNDEGIDESEYISDSHVVVIETLDAESKLKEFYNKGYVLLGSASFYSEWVPFSQAIDVAKDKGASVVIFDTEVTGSKKKSYTMAIPQTNTTYHTGSINTYGTYGSSYSSYQGTSTSTSYDYATFNYEVTGFQQTAYFLAPKTNEGE